MLLIRKLLSKDSLLFNKKEKTLFNNIKLNKLIFSILVYNIFLLF